MYVSGSLAAWKWAPWSVKGWRGPSRCKVVDVWVHERVTSQDGHCYKNSSFKQELLYRSFVTIRPSRLTLDGPMINFDKTNQRIEII
jgi:hypothetical protein